MKKLLFLIYILSVPSGLFAQTGWFPLPNGPHSRTFYSIYFVNADTGFVSSGEGKFKTTDGGVSWSAMEVDGGEFKFFNHNRLGFILGGEWKTTDSGATWQHLKLQVLDLDFPSDSIGYSVGFSTDTSMVSFGKTTNGGISWSYKNILPVVPRMRVVDAKWLSFRDELHGFVTEEGEAQDGSGGGEFGYYTSDGGMNWIQGHGYGAVLYLHDSTWLTTTSTGGIYKTDNDFKSGRYVGQKIPSDACGPLGYHLCKFDTNVVSSFDKRFGAIYRSTDAGETWYFQRCGTANSSNVALGDITTPTRLVGYVVGIDSQIYKTIDGGGPPFTSSVKKVSTENFFYLLSNPITVSADFQFSPFSAPKTFALFDLLGKELMRREVSVGETSFTLDMQKYPAGIYLARLGEESVKIIKI